MHRGLSVQTKATMVLQSIHKLLPEHDRVVMVFGWKSEFQSTSGCCGKLNISLREPQGGRVETEGRWYLCSREET